MGKNTIEAKQWFDKRYGDSAPWKSTIIDWYAEFKRSRINTDVAKRSRRPKSAVVPETITKVHKIVLGDRKLKLREIADTLRRFYQYEVDHRVHRVDQYHEVVDVATPPRFFLVSLLNLAS